MRRFEFSDSTSNKFWEVDVKGKTLNVAFGKIGTKGQSKPKDFTTPEKAKAEMEKLIKEKTGKGYVEVGGKVVKAAKPVAKKTKAGSVGEGLSKAEKQAKAEKVLLMFAGGQWELARGILEVAQDEHWLFEELLKGSEINYGKPVPSRFLKKIFGEIDDEGFWADEFDYEGEPIVYYDEPIKASLLMLEVLFHLPKELTKLQKLFDKLIIKITYVMLSKYWKEVTEHRFSGVKYTDPRDFNNRWYEERNTEIARVKKEGDARSKALNKPWQEVADLGKSVKLEMVLIPAGTFLMGSDGPDPEELPHEVTITKCFYFGKYAVTQEQWAAVMGNNLSRYKGPKLPITNVSWNDCQEFIKKLNASTKGGYRLPTEAEWEYVCKAGTMSFGDEIGPEDANCADSGIDKPIEVGSYRPNPFGLYDMYGNVREWCEDRYQVYYYFYYDAVTDPKGPASGKRRVLRGGSFSTDFVELDRAERIDLSPASRDSHNGFRLVRTI